MRLSCRRLQRWARRKLCRSLATVASTLPTPVRPAGAAAAARRAGAAAGTGSEEAGSHKGAEGRGVAEDTAGVATYAAGPRALGSRKAIKESKCYTNYSEGARLSNDRQRSPPRSQPNKTAGRCQATESRKQGAPENPNAHSNEQPIASAES
jgi:hypothetical protein